MSETMKLVGETREKTGTASSLKMRSSGRVPGVLYGLNLDPVPLSVSEEALRPLVSTDTKVVEVELGGKSELALVRELQWDTFSKYVQHFDLQRIDPTKRVTVEIAVELKGTAPGVVDGGILDHSQRTVQIECLAHQIPDHIFVRIGELQIGDALHVSDLEVPPGATYVDDPTTLIVRVNAPQEEEELEEGEEGAY